MKPFLFPLLFTLCTIFTAAQRLNSNAGDLAPNVKVLDVDDFCSVSSRMCIVSKGDKKALIDMNGNFITPWGKYKFLSNYPECGFKQFYEGLVKVQDKLTSKVGFINRKGQAVIPIQYGYNELGNYSLAGICQLRKNNFLRTTIYLDTLGNAVFNINEDKNHFYGKPTDEKNYLKDNRDVKLFLFSQYLQVGNGSYLYGFMDKKGKVIINPIFQAANAFYDGMASVGKKDDFGIMKWGFIDSTGKLAIPYQYSIEPGSFHEGLALVEATSVANFQYAYINKQGEIKLKIERRYAGTNFYPTAFDFEIGNSNYQYTLKEKGNFFNGYSLWANGKENYLMNTSGKIFSFGEFLSTHYAVSDSLIYGLKSITDKGIEFSTIRKDKYDDDQKVGIIDFSGNTVFRPVFSTLEPDYFSSYAIATYLLADNPVVNKREYRKGIINQEGLFVVIKSEKQEVW